VYDRARKLREPDRCTDAAPAGTPIAVCPRMKRMDRLSCVGIVVATAFVGAGCDAAPEGDVLDQAEVLVTSQSDDADVDASSEEQAVIVKFPGQFATLQQAADATPDGGVLRIGAGTFYGAIHISGKTITVAGRGAQATRLDGANVAAPLVSLGPGAGVILKKLSLRTDHVAVAGGSQNGAAHLVHTSQVAFLEPEVAVEGRFEEVELRRTAIAGATRAGIALRDTPRSVFRTIAIDCSDPGCKAGIHVDNSATPSAWVSLRDLEVDGGEAGGVAVLGGGVLKASNVSVSHAGTFGIGLFGVPDARLDSVSVVSTHARSDGAYGDGFVLWASGVELVASLAQFSARADLLLQACSDRGQPGHLELEGGRFGPSPLFLDVESFALDGGACASGSFTVVDAGDNVCFGPTFSPIVCHASSSALTPIELPSPP
jgi:hypothetical protein